MAIKHPLLRKSLALLGAWGGKLLRATIDWRAVYCDASVDTLHPQHRGRYVYAGWHEYMLMPILLRGDARMLALVSQSNDGELIGQAMAHLGWRIARGSSTRGGASALLSYLRDDERNPNLTPDGPKGPRRTMSSGAIFLASKLGLPMVCVGYAYDRPWRLRSWDRFAVPRPFSRGRAAFGPPMRLPTKMDRDTLERYRQWFEDLLNWLTEEAETWTTSGQQRTGEVRMWHRHTARALLKWDAASALRLPDGLTRRWQDLSNERAA